MLAFSIANHKWLVSCNSCQIKKEAFGSIRYSMTLMKFSDLIQVIAI